MSKAGKNPQADKVFYIKPYESGYMFKFFYIMPNRSL